MARRRPPVAPAREPSNARVGAARTPAAPPLSLKHPAALLVLALAALGVCSSVSFQLIDTDFWQHLAVGKAMWTLKSIPQQHLWTWPNYGAHEVLWSWGFRAIIAPIYEAFGVPGLFGWRWATTLAAFGLAFAAARRMGARGLTPLVVIVWCSLVYRHRSQIRPETLAAVLTAATILILELRRPRPFGGGGSDRLWWLVPVAWVWINVHLSYFLLFVLLGFHLADELLRGARATGPDRMGGVRRLALVFAACAGVVFLNPFGWEAVWQPFDYFLRLRHEPHFQGIGELQPLGWLNNQTNGVFAMIALWPLLMLWRFRRRGFDLVELLVCGLFTAWMISSQRFFGSYAIAAAPYLARDLDDWVATRRWPAWTAGAWPRAGLATLAIAGVGFAEWSRADRPLSVSIDMKRFPVHATEFMARHGVKGRGFTQTAMGGWQIWRFWPDRERLPFMDIHQTGTPRDRELYTYAFTRSGGWEQLDHGDRFDYVLLDPYQSDTLLDALDADTSMALTFLDDAGVLYVRTARLQAVADSFGYRWLGAGGRRIAAVFAAAATDSNAAAGVAAELEQMAASSPWNARAHSLLATRALEQERLADARRHLEQALAVDPRTPLAHSRLAGIALFEERPDDAIRHFERERELFGPQPGIEFGLGMAKRLQGDRAAALEHFEREIRHDPRSPAAGAARQAAAER